jgi:hypothetical protein
MRFRLLHIERAVLRQRLLPEWFDLHRRGTVLSGCPGVQRFVLSRRSALL